MTRFASLGGSSVGDYAAAGKAVADSAATAFAIQRKTAPDYGDISKAAMSADAQKFKSAAAASAKVAKSGIKSYTDVTQMGQKVAVVNDRIDKFKKQKMAGSIAAIGKIAGAGVLAATDNTKGRERPKADRQSIIDKFNTSKDAINSKYKTDSEAIPEFKPSVVTPAAGTAGKAVGGSTSGSQGLSGTNLSGEQFDMSKLTPKDFDDLAFAVSSEAQLGTDDEYGVAANILTRLKSGNYGGTVNSIIHAPGQYEGVYKGMSVASPNISSRFQSAEGRNKLQEAMQRLGGRTEFKGQTMLQNRVAAEDPMFSPGGNFYHFAGQ